MAWEDFAVLLDHFHPPLSEQRDWHGFHNAWATYLSADLNRTLPERWFAQPHVEFGVEIDVATMEEAESLRGETTEVDPTRAVWVPPAPTMTISLPFIADIVEVQVFRQSGGRILVGAIELVSPANKDRPETREAFVAKCESLLCAGIGLVVVDIVTSRHASLHEELVDRLGCTANASSSQLYAVAYRPVQRDEEPSADLWENELHLGRPLPSMPLYLKGGTLAMVDLQSTYQRTCEEQRIPHLPARE